MLISGDPARHRPDCAAAFKLFGNRTLLGVMGILGDVGRLG